MTKANRAVARPSGPANPTASANPSGPKSVRLPGESYWKLSSLVAKARAEDMAARHQVSVAKAAAVEVNRFLVACGFDPNGQFKLDDETGTVSRVDAPASPLARDQERDMK